MVLMLVERARSAEFAAYMSGVVYLSDRVAKALSSSKS